MEINAKTKRRKANWVLPIRQMGVIRFPMETLTLKVPPDLANWLNKRAKELNRPKSEIVRQALLAQRNGEKKSESLLDRAGDLVGKYSGSRHSSHKRNLKGFGLKSLGRWKHS
jgi:hypothetical protein